jgi:hypothetical protein
MSATDMIRFDQLPLDPEGPPGNAWGRFGKDDELGMLNLITPGVIVKAAQEIKTGVRISLDWPLSMPSYPSFGRNPFQQEIVHRAPNYINDDVLHFNTQGSTQWDGFRHYGMTNCLPGEMTWPANTGVFSSIAHQKSRRFYNNRTQEQIESSDIIGLHGMPFHMLISRSI